MSVAEAAFIRSTRESVPSHETRSVDARCLIRRRVAANLLVPRSERSLASAQGSSRWLGGSAHVTDSWPACFTFTSSHYYALFKTLSISFVRFPWQSSILTDWSEKFKAEKFPTTH